MNKGLLLGIGLTFATGVAFAQAQGGVTAGPQGYQAGNQSASGKGGVQIQGNTQINANATNTSAVASGQGNTAKNAVGGIRGDTQIQGNTKINANAKNTTAVATGKGNKAENAVGVIGK